MNLELDNLRLEFLNEEIDHPRPRESRGANKQKGCGCLIVQQDDFKAVSTTVKEM
jgi:hypothetical protein